MERLPFKIDCIRCGVCCSTGACSKGLEDDNGICEYLIFNKDEGRTTSCKLFLENKVKGNEIGLGTGCVLRTLPKIYDYYKKSAQSRWNAENY